MKAFRAPRSKSSVQAASETCAKSATGIAGVDEITGGGLPPGRTTLMLGSPGSGKTIVALQFLIHGARNRAMPIIKSRGTAHSNQVRATSLQTELVAKQVEKKLLARTTQSRERELLRGRSRMREVRGADAAATKEEPTP